MEKLSIIGCGTMGHSIALSASWAGLKVKMYGTGSEDLKAAEHGMESKLAVMAESGLLTAEESADIRSRILITVNLNEAVEDSTFVIEAIPENLKLKQDFYQELEKLIDQETIIASNTSGLMPTELSTALQHPERFVITHFWNPAHLIPLVEVVAAERTSNDTIDRAMVLLKLIGKQPIIVKKEVPGFIGNRLQYALFREAQHLIDEGIADKEDIDAAVTYSIGRRLPVTGPLMSADLGGLDVFKSISDYLFRDLSDEPGSGRTITNLVDEGKLGLKTGEGFYEWGNGRGAAISRDRERMLIRFLEDDLERRQKE